MPLYTGLIREHYASTPSVLRFSHVFIDEAGQALLPEALIPLALLSPPPAGAAAAPGGCGAVLCGDPQQLGPVVRSPAAAAAGLSTSLLELLIRHHSAVAPGLEAAGRVAPVTQLRANYRSHRRLLDLPSKLFYRGTLIAAADQAAVRAPAWGELRGEEPGSEGGDPETAGSEDAGGGSEGGGSAEAAAAAAQSEVEEEAEAAEEAEWREEEAEEAEEAEEGGLDTEDLPNLLVYGERGAQAREGDAHSYFNAIEVRVLDCSSNVPALTWHLGFASTTVDQCLHDVHWPDCLTA